MNDRLRSFAYSSYPIRVVFGAGTLAGVREEVERLGCAAAFVLSGPRLATTATRVRATLGPVAVGAYDGAAMHTPVEVTEAALAQLRTASADCLVAVGGGSTIGLAKALALRTGLPQVVLPTTYAGSEVTPVLGETTGGRKTTRTTAAVVPNTVVYDVELTLDLPVQLSVTSGVNALAHAVEAVYAPDANPAIDALALHAIAGMSGALPRIVRKPTDVYSRAEALEAAWLAGTCLGGVPMGLHHKLCHTLGGSFGLPHAATHTVVLPHVMAYNAAAAPDAMRRVAVALDAARSASDAEADVAVVPGSADAGAGAVPGGAGPRDAAGLMYDLIESLHGPTSLRGLGMAEADVPKAVDLALQQSYANPRELTASGLSRLLDDAWHGRRPRISE